MGNKQRKIILCIDDNIEVLKSLRFQLRQHLMRDIRIILENNANIAH